MLKKKRYENILTFVLFAIFSVPMASIWFLPFSLLKPVYSDFYLVPFLITLLIVAPWAFLIMAVSFYMKQLRLQVYVATILFSWAAATQLFFILARLLDYYFTFSRFV
jgi:hypothetical protein